MGEYFLKPKLFGANVKFEIDLHENVLTWKSKHLSSEKHNTPTNTDKSLSPSIKWYENSSFCLIIKGSCSNQKNALFTAANLITFLLLINKIFYELDIL